MFLAKQRGFFFLHTNWAPHLSKSLALHLCMCKISSSLLPILENGDRGVKTGFCRSWIIINRSRVFFILNFIFHRCLASLLEFIQEHKLMCWWEKGKELNNWNNCRFTGNTNGIFPHIAHPIAVAEWLFSPSSWFLAVPVTGGVQTWQSCCLR